MNARADDLRACFLAGYEVGDLADRNMPACRAAVAAVAVVRLDAPERLPAISPTLLALAVTP